MTSIYNSRWFFALTIATFASGIFILVEGLSYSKSIEATAGYCSINNVAYTRNIHDTQNMAKCDCGRRCVSSEGTTMTLYGTFYTYDNQKIHSGTILTDVNKHTGGYTYHEKYCKRITRSEALRIIYKKAKPYIEKKNTTNTIDCYHMNDQLYLTNDYDVNIFILSCVLFCLCLLSCMITCLCNFIKKTRNKTIDV